MTRELSRYKSILDPYSSPSEMDSNSLLITQFQIHMFPNHPRIHSPHVPLRPSHGPWHHQTPPRLGQFTQPLAMGGTKTGWAGGHHALFLCILVVTRVGDGVPGSLYMSTICLVKHGSHKTLAKCTFTIPPTPLPFGVADPAAPPGPMTASWSEQLAAKGSKAYQSGSFLGSETCPARS